MNSKSIEQLDKSIIKFGPPLTVYLNDVEAIAEILRRDCDRLEIEVETENGRYKATTTDQLLEIDDSGIESCEIRCREPYLTVGFRRTSRWLYSSSSSATSIGIVHQLEELLKKRDPWDVRFVNTYSWRSLIISGTAIIVWYAILIFLRDNWALLATSLALVAAAWAIAEKALYWDPGMKNKVLRLESRSDASNYWSRHKDQIVIGTIVTALGGLIAAMVWSVLS